MKFYQKPDTYQMRAEESVLFLTAVHGDEGFSIPVLQALGLHIPWLIANEKALARGVRFIDADLNRVAPGCATSDKYEVRRASELIEIAKKYPSVIDIHGTTANSGIFTIVTNPTPVNFALATSLPIERVVIWVAKSSEMQGPLTQFMNCAVEIECGPKNSKEVWIELEEILGRFLYFRSSAGGHWSHLVYPEHEWFRVCGKLGKEISLQGKSLVDFQEVELHGESFYPLLVGQYADALCYKMQKINFWDMLSY